MASSLWLTITWNIARAGGWTTYLFLTLSVIVGLLLSTQIQSPSRWPRLINSELHNFLSLVGTIFLGIHILAVWVDSYTRFGWKEILIPFASHYQPLPMALGIIAVYLGIAIGISTIVRSKIGYALWKKLHILTLVIFVIATIHGIGIGSDTKTTWALEVYLLSVVIVGLLLGRRLFLVWEKKKRSNPPARSLENRPYEKAYRMEPARMTRTTIRR